MASPQSEVSEVQWMYKNSSDLINREDYLLGRKIDKNLEQAGSEKNNDGKQTYEAKLPKNHVEHECIPFSIRAYRGALSTEQVDIQRKVMEDPLTVIKQKEIESRRKILENPVKLKELRGLLRSESEITKDDESRTKKNKSTSSTNKKRKHLSHEEQSDKLDKLVIKKYEKIQKILHKYKAKKNMNVRKLVKTSKKKISKEFRKMVKQSKKRKQSSSSSSSEHHSRRIKDTTPRKQYKRKEEANPKSREMLPREKYFENTRKGLQQDMRRNDRSMDVVRNNIPYRRDRQPERSSNNTRNREMNDSRKHRSSEEKEAYRKMMMENAIWNDEKCAQNVERYRNERRKEEESHYNSEFNKDFISRELLSSLSSKGSVESRIKSNLNNIQRCPGSMESKFL